MSPTRQQVEATSAELDYMNYRDARDGDESMPAIRAHFGRNTAELEARYQAELGDRKAKSAADEMQGQLSREEARRA